MTKYQSFCKQIKPASFYYKIRKTNDDKMYNTFIRWQQRLSLNCKYSVFMKYFTNINSISNNSKYYSFQYRLLNFAVITNVQLCQWKIVSSMKCTFCQKNDETLEHLFYECETALKIIELYLVLLKEYQKQKDVHLNYNISVATVLMNNVMQPPIHLLNFLILCAKQYIYSRRCIKEKCTVAGFKKVVENARRIELYNAKQNKKIGTYLLKWHGIRVKKGQTNAQNEELEEYVKQIVLESNIDL